MKANRAARQDAAAAAVLEDLPVLIVITLAIGIFVVTGLKALANYKAGWAAEEEFEDGFERAQFLRAHPAFLLPGVVQAGEFDLRQVAQTQVDINTQGEDAGREILDIPEFVKVRILDASGMAARGAPTATAVDAGLAQSPCPSRDCPVFVFQNKVDDATGRAIVHFIPVTLRVADGNVHAALLEVTFWRA